MKVEIPESALKPYKTRPMCVTGDDDAPTNLKAHFGLRAGMTIWWCGMARTKKDALIKCRAQLIAKGYLFELQKDILDDCIKNTRRKKKVVAKSRKKT